MRKPTVTRNVADADLKRVEIDEATHTQLLKYAKDNGYKVHGLATILIRDGLKQRQLATSA